GMTGWIETLRVTGFPPYEGNSCTERINGEFELMRYMRRKGILIPSKPNEKQIEKNRHERENFPHEGGTVLYPEGMLHTGVVIVDFRSMYPSVMVAHNIGGETLKNWIRGDHHGNALKLFNGDSRSALSIMERELVEKRVAKKEQISELKEQLKNCKDKKAKKELVHTINVLEREQSSMKIVANAMYGAHYYIRSRFYSQALAGAIADSARMYLLNVKEHLKEVSEKIIPCELVYGDTDSAFIKLLDTKLIQEIYDESDPIKREALTRLLKDNIIASMIKMLNEKLPKPIELNLKDIAYRCVFKPERKKAYAYSSLLSGKIDIKGFEAVRSDWSPIAQAAQKKVLEIFLTAREEEEENIRLKRRNHSREEFNKAEKFLLVFGKKVLSAPTEQLLPLITTYSPIKQHPNLYKAMPPGVFAFLDFCQREGLDKDKEWLTYDKFPWVIIPGPGPVFKRARHPKYAQDIDRDFYVRQMFLGIRTFGLETNLNDVLNTKNDNLTDLIQQSRKEEEHELPEGILPYSGMDLAWKTPAKGNRKKREQSLVAGQSQLNVFLEKGDE
ncbi:MAG: DNA polymerase domain-containing protein, partial [Candidatus Thorarchaeota archaeon]